MLEHKFIRNAGIVGHIEDIVVSRELQGRKLGLRIIDALGEIGAATGCYKIILDCDQKNVGECQAFKLQKAIVVADSLGDIQLSTRNAGAYPFLIQRLP